MRENGACKDRNPKTGKAIEVKSKKGAFFKVGRELKKRVAD